MGQVPKHSYLIVGDGRLARHLYFYLSHKPISLDQWSRSKNTRLDLKQKIEKHSHILLAISDDSLDSFYLENKYPGKNFFHFSGNYYHPEIQGLHPLMTFSKNLYDLDFYEKVPFVGDLTSEEFKTLWPFLENPYFFINKDNKSAYHSFCTLFGNGTTLLWKLFAEKMNELGLPNSIVKPYFSKIAENILKEEPGRFTGPWYRNDQKTITNHLDTLNNTPLSDIYAQLYQHSQTVIKKGDLDEKHSSAQTI